MESKEYSPIFLNSVTFSLYCYLCLINHLSFPLLQRSLQQRLDHKYAVLENLMAENIKKEEKEHFKNINHSNCLLHCDELTLSSKFSLEERVALSFICRQLSHGALFADYSDSKLKLLNNRASC